MDQNLENYQKIKKKPVVFGTPIQLYHTKSQKFLAFRSIDKESSLSAGQYRYRQLEYNRFDQIIIQIALAFDLLMTLARILYSKLCQAISFSLKITGM